MCAGASDTARITLSRGEEVLVAIIPKGAAFFRGELTSAEVDLDTKLRLHQSSSSYCVAGYACEVDTGATPCPPEIADGLRGYESSVHCNRESVNGMDIIYSGDDHAPPVREIVHISSELSQTLYYKVTVPSSAKAAPAGNASSSGGASAAGIVVTVKYEYGAYPASSVASGSCASPVIMGLPPRPPSTPPVPPTPPAPRAPLQRRRELSGGACLLDESFDGATLNILTDTLGWKVLEGTNQLGGTHAWQFEFDNFAQHHLLSKGDNVAGGLAEDWLVTPQITPTAEAHKLEFWQKQQWNLQYGSIFTVRVSEADVATCTSSTNVCTISAQDAQGFTTVDTQPESPVKYYWSPYQVSLSDYIGKPIFIAFVHTNDNGDYWYIDRVKVCPLPAAPSPSPSPPSPLPPSPSPPLPLGPPSMPPPSPPPPGFAFEASHGDSDTCDLYYTPEGLASNCQIQYVVDPGLCAHYDQLGGDIDGEQANDRFGAEVALSSAGHTVAIGNYYWSSDSRLGQVRVFDWDELTANWVQKGSTLVAAAVQDGFGSSIALSSLGHILVIGASLANRAHPNGVNDIIAVGTVHVYEWDPIAAEWATRAAPPIEVDFVGPQQVGHMNTGSSIALSSDGSILAIGAPRARLGTGDFSTGKVNVYEWDPNAAVWESRGAAMFGEGWYDRFGTSVALSGDGSVIAVGAPYADAVIGVHGNRGKVRIFEWSAIDNAWVPRAGVIQGDASHDNLGHAKSVALSSDGSIVAVSAHGATVGHRGYVRVFHWDGLTYTQRGVTISGEGSCDNSGYSVALSGDGSILAIGARNNYGNGVHSGHVRVYKWDANDGWMKPGLDIDGEAAGDESGESVALSSDGSIIAIGAGDANSGGHALAGHVRVFTTRYSVCGDGEAPSPVAQIESSATSTSTGKTSQTLQCPKSKRMLSKLSPLEAHVAFAAEDAWDDDDEALA